MAVRIRTDSRTADSGGCAGQCAHWWAGPAATEFLQRMQRRQAGVTTARRCVPRLLRAIRTQGWPRLTEMDAAHRVLLEADIPGRGRGKGVDPCDTPGLEQAFKGNVGEQLQWAKPPELHRTLSVHGGRREPQCPAGLHPRRGCSVDAHTLPDADPWSATTTGTRRCRVFGDDRCMQNVAESSTFEGRLHQNRGRVPGRDRADEAARTRSCRRSLSDRITSIIAGSPKRRSVLDIDVTSTMRSVCRSRSSRTGSRA